jgi:hypothetical protein
MKCNCHLCQMARKAARVTKRGTKVELRAFIGQLWDLYETQMLDANVDAAIIDGSWPHADDIIAFRREGRVPHSTQTPTETSSD